MRVCADFTKLGHSLSCAGKTNVRMTLNPVIVKALSAVAAAITNVGTPTLLPKPRATRDSIEGITTAGDTPAITNLQGELIILLKLRLDKDIPLSKHTRALTPRLAERIKGPSERVLARHPL